MGCQEAQGFGIAKPMPADDILEWLNNYMPNQEWLLYNNMYRSDKEKKVKLFKLVSKHWMGKFIGNLQA